MPNRTLKGTKSGTRNTVKTYKILRTPETSAASNTAQVAYTPPPPMLSIDNTGVARINWASQVMVWQHDGAIYIRANNVVITMRKS